MKARFTWEWNNDVSALYMWLEDPNQNDKLIKRETCPEMSLDSR